jgi:hypothetical protein
VKSDMHELRNRHREEMLELRESVKTQAKARRRPSR